MLLPTLDQNPESLSIADLFSPSLHISPAHPLVLPPTVPSAQHTAPGTWHPAPTPIPSSPLTGRALDYLSSSFLSLIITTLPYLPSALILFFLFFTPPPPLSLPSRCTTTDKSEAQLVPLGPGLHCDFLFPPTIRRVLNLEVDSLLVTSAAKARAVAHHAVYVTHYSVQFKSKSLTHLRPDRGQVSGLCVFPKRFERCC